ncbi:MAG: cupin domain-containing protein, partial [bacterium]
EPGGYSSLEKHHHAHVIICSRGMGALKLDGEDIILQTNDIAYVAPMQVHQLYNKAKEPFGFYCIVDHKRNRPMKP